MSRTAWIKVLDVIMDIVFTATLMQHMLAIARTDTREIIAISNLCPIPTARRTTSTVIMANAFMTTIRGITAVTAQVKTVTKVQLHQLQQ